MLASVTRLGDLSLLGQIFKACSSIFWAKQLTFLENIEEGLEICCRFSSENCIGSFGQLLHLDWATFYSKLPVTLVLAKEELKRFFYNVHRFAFQIILHYWFYYLEHDLRLNVANLEVQLETHCIVTSIKYCIVNVTYNWLKCGSIVSWENSKIYLAINNLNHFMIFQHIFM